MLRRAIDQLDEEVRRVAERLIHGNAPRVGGITGGILNSIKCSAFLVSGRVMHHLHAHHVWTLFL